MNKQEQAVAYHKAGYNCSQAVLAVFCEELGLDKEVATKLATSFGGGMRCGEVCGGVTGALMALGLKHGQVEAEDQDTKMKAYGITKDFQERFRKRNGSILCKELLGHNMGTEEGMKCIQEKGLIQTKCNDLIADAVTILEEMFNEEKAV